MDKNELKALRKARMALEEEKKQIQEESDRLERHLAITSKSLISQDLLALFADYKEYGRECSCKSEELRFIKEEIQHCRWKNEEFFKIVPDSKAIAGKDEELREMAATRLYAATAYVNKIIAQNEQRLSAIDDLLAEHEIYSKHFDMISTELSFVEMAIDDSFKSYKNEHATVDRMNQKSDELKSTAQKNLADRTIRARNLLQKIDDITRENEFIAIKKQDRSQQIFDFTSSESEATNRSEVVPQAFHGPEETVHVVSEDSFNKYILDREFQIKVMQSTEERYRLFERMRYQRGKLDQHIDQFNAMQAKLNAKLNRKKRDREVIENKHKVMLKQEQKVKVVLKNLYKSLGCKSEELTQRLGDNLNVARENFKFFLIAIEQRLREISFSTRYMGGRLESAQDVPLETFRIKIPTPPCVYCAEKFDIDRNDYSAYVLPDFVTMKKMLVTQMRKGERAHLCHDVEQCPLMRSGALNKTKTHLPKKHE